MAHLNYICRVELYLKFFSGLVSLGFPLGRLAVTVELPGRVFSKVVCLYQSLQSPGCGPCSGPGVVWRSCGSQQLIGRPVDTAARGAERGTVDTVLTLGIISDQGKHWAGADM